MYSRNDFSEYTVPHFWMNIYLAVIATLAAGAAELFAGAGEVAVAGGDVGAALGGQVGNVVGPTVVMPG